MIDAQEIRKDFPIFSRTMQGKPLVYLDSAATSQKPRQVIEAVSLFYWECNANVHRGIYDLSEEATERFEGARKKVAGFLGATPQETVFTRNATEALNLVARAYGDWKLPEGGSVLISAMEHHSNIVPWQQLAARKQGKLMVAEVTPEGFLDEDDFGGKLEQGPEIVALSLCSNVLGTINPVKELARKAKRAGAAVVVDAAQAAPHMTVDFTELGCDFLAVSGHKMLGPMGSGALIGRKELLEQMPPFLGGGDMIREVSFQASTWNELPYKFEAGTPSVADAVGLGAAVDYLQGLGMDQVRLHEKMLTRYALEQLGKAGVDIYGPRDVEKKGGVVAFNIPGVHAHDVATVMNAQGIALRAGHHCAQPLMKRLGVQATARASFYVYNDEKEVDVLAAAIGKTKKLFA